MPSKKAIPVLAVALAACSAGSDPSAPSIESTAATLPEIIREMLLTRTSERQGRLIDHDQAGSMEKKKQDGYF